MSVAIRQPKNTGVVSTLNIFANELDVIDAASVDAASMRNELAERNASMQGMEAEIEALRLFVPHEQQMAANESRMERQRLVVRQQSIDLLKSKLIATRVQLAALTSRQSDILADLRLLSWIESEAPSNTTESNNMFA